MDLIPLWNVEPISLKCTIFPIPAIDEWNYRHTLRLPFVQDGYVVRMEQAVKHVYMSQAGLEVISEEKVQRDFSLYRIAVRRDINIPHYPLTSNFRRMRHIDRQADNALFRPRTRAEMARIVTSYEAGENLELLEISQGECGPIGGRWPVSLQPRRTGTVSPEIPGPSGRIPAGGPGILSRAGGTE